MKHITGDKNIENLCREIYTKYKDVLDIIFENCKASRIAACGIIDDWCQRKCENNELFMTLSSPITHTPGSQHRQSASFSLLWQNPSAGGNPTILLSMKSLNVKTISKLLFTVCSDNVTAKQREACAEISKYLNRPDKKQNWRWKRIWNRNRHTISPDLQEDEYRLEVEKVWIQNGQLFKNLKRVL